MKAFLRANWDRAMAVVLVVLGAAALLLGWIGVSGTGLAAEQNPYLISGGVAGIALIAIGCTIWLSSDLQDEWRRLDAVEERLSELVAAQGHGRVDASSNGAVVDDRTLEPDAEIVPAPAARRGARRVVRTPAS